MKRLPFLLLLTAIATGCAPSKPVEVKQKEEALHRGLSEAAKKADPAKNLKEASDAIRTFKISDAADAGFKKHQVKNQERKQARRNTPDKPDNQSQPSQATHPERKSP
jgi:hypothetical protein